MQLTKNGRITRQSLEDSFYVDQDRRRVLAERKRQKTQRRLRAKLLRQTGFQPSCSPHKPFSSSPCQP
jgi:hypothetical protein